MNKFKSYDSKGEIEYTIPQEFNQLEGAKVEFVMQDPKGNLLVHETVTLIDYDTGFVVYRLQELDTAVSGKHKAEFQVTYADGSFLSFPRQGYIEVQVIRNIDSGRATVAEQTVAIQVSLIDQKFDQIKADNTKFKGDVDTKVAAIESDTEEWRKNVAADVLEEVYPQVDVERVSNEEVRAARKGEATLSAKMDKVDSQLAQTMTQTEFDSWVATLLDGGPSIFFDTYNQLVQAYPEGASGVALIRATDPAKIYVWVENAWKLYGDYQGIELKDKTVTPTKTTFIDEYISPQLLNKNSFTDNKMYRNSSNALITEMTDSTAFFASNPIYRDFSSGDQQIKLNGYSPNGTTIIYYFLDGSTYKRAGAVNYSGLSIENGVATFTIPKGNTGFETKAFTVSINKVGLMVNGKSADFDTAKNEMICTLLIKWDGKYHKYGESNRILKGINVENESISIEKLDAPLRNRINSFGEGGDLPIDIDSIFDEKKVIFTGDSIVEGKESNGGFVRLFAESFPKATVQNKGISGRTIATNVSGREANPIVNLIDGFDIDADYIILEGGVNDAFSNVKMFTGNLTDVDTHFSTGYPRQATYNQTNNTWSNLNRNAATTVIADTDTFQGALETLLLKTMLKYPTKKYGYILTHRMGRGLWEQYQKPYWEVARKICAKYRFPLLDLTDSSLMVSEVTALQQLYFKQDIADDWVHPSELGYRIGYLNKIIEWMKSL